MHTKVSKNIDFKIFTLTTLCNKRGKSECEWHVTCLTAVLVKMSRGMDIFRVSVDVLAKRFFHRNKWETQKGLRTVSLGQPKGWFNPITIQNWRTNWIWLLCYFKTKLLDFITWKENNARAVVLVNRTPSGVPAATLTEQHELPCRLKCKFYWAKPAIHKNGVFLLSAESWQWISIPSSINSTLTYP